MSLELPVACKLLAGARLVDNTSRLVSLYPYSYLEVYMMGRSGISGGC